MDRRREASALAECGDKIRAKQAKLENLKLEENHIGVQQGIDEIREDSKDIKEIKEKLDEIKKVKGHTSDFERTESEHLAVEDLALQKKRCLEALLYINETEDLYQNLQQEIEDRALYLSDRRRVFESVYRTQDIDVQSRVHKDFVYSLRNVWGWLSQVNKCLEIHLNNAADYHQFFHDVRFLEEDMISFLSWMDSEVIRNHVKTKDTELMTQHLRAVTNKLLEYQGRLEKLCRKCNSVVPLHWRREMPSHPIKAKSLVTYEHHDITLREDEVCTVIDNSEADRWKVQNSQGREAEVPGIILVIPPPDQKAFDAVHTLQEQMVVHFETAAIKRLRNHMLQFLNLVMKDTTPRGFQNISPSQKAAHLKLINECVTILRSSNPSDDKDFKDFIGQVTNFRKIISQIKPGNKDISNPTIHRWKAVDKTVIVYKELLTYLSHHKEAVEKSREQAQLLISDTDRTHHYCSKAYFERALPLIDLDPKTKALKSTKVKAEIYIHERHRGKKPTPPPRRKRQRQHVAEMNGSDVKENSGSASAEEVKTVLLKSVLDPRNNHRLSVPQAAFCGIIDYNEGIYRNPDTGDIMSIPEAIHGQNIEVNNFEIMTNGDVIDGTTSGDSLKSYLLTQSFPIIGAIDPRTGEMISVKDAISSGAIDIKNGMFRNPLTGENMTVMQAVQNGYLIADSSLINDNEPNVFTHLDFVDTSYIISSVVDPVTGQNVSLRSAINDGSFDPVGGYYRNPTTGEQITVQEAIRQGLIQGRLFDTSKDTLDGNVVGIKELIIKKERAMVDSAVEGAMFQNGKDTDSNLTLYKKLKKRISASTCGIKDPESGQMLSIEEAVCRGIINLSKAQYENSDGEVMTLNEACTRGLIDPNVLKELLKTYSNCSVGELIDNGTFDPETGLVTELTTGKTFTYEAAAAKHIIEPDTTFFYDKPSQRILSLSAAADDGLYNNGTAKYVAAGNGEEMTFTKAEEKFLLSSHVNPAEIEECSKSLNQMKNVMDLDVKGVVIPNVKDSASVQEAICAGVLHIPDASYGKDIMNDTIPLTDAIKAEKINTKAAVAIFDGLNKLSLQEAMKNNTIDADRCKFINPQTGETMTFAEAREKGIFDPNFLFFVDNTANEVSSLGSFIDKAKFDTRSGKFLEPRTNSPLTITDAIKKGLINPEINTQKFVDTSSSLKSFIDTAKENPKNIQFMAPNGQKMSLRDALANGFITMTSKINMDPETGNVVLASEEESVVTALLDVKEATDWISGIEKSLASMSKPSEKLEKLKRQTETVKEIRKDIRGHESEVSSTVKQAEKVVDSNKSNKKDDAAQQIQKLRSSTSDLKVRFDTASNESSKRENTLSGMTDHLEGCYGKLENMEDWLDHAIEKSHELQVSNKNLEVLFDKYKVFIEEVKSKEDLIADIFKDAEKFKDDSRDFERDAENFRSHLTNMPTIKEETDLLMLDDEIESLSAKYRDISRECMRQMDKLASLMKSKKSFADLKDKILAGYPHIEEKLDIINIADIGKNLETDHQNMENISDVKGDLISQDRKLKDFLITGERLAKGLDDLNMRVAAEEVRREIGEWQFKHDEVSCDLKDKEEQISCAISEHQNITSRLNAVEDWLDDAEELLSEQKAISLNKEKLAAQIEENSLMNSELDGKRLQLERMAKDSVDFSSPEAAQKVEDLRDRIDGVENRYKQRAKEMEDISTSLNEFEVIAGTLDSWLDSASQNVKQKSKVKDAAYKAKINALCEEKKEKAHEMEVLQDISKQIMEDERVCDTYTLKQNAADVQSKWHDLTEFLVQQVSLEALGEIDGMLKYLDKAENEINTAEPISIDPETLRIQLNDHQAFNDDLNERRNAVKVIIDKCNKMLRETTNSQTDEIKNRLDSIRSQADIVCQLSAERLQQLSSALPLAGHFIENHGEVKSWLDEMEAEVKSQSGVGENLEQIKKQEDNLKATLQIIDDHKPFIDDLNSTGLELMELCSDEDANEIQNKLLEIDTRYDSVKLSARQKQRDLNEARKKMTQEVSETLDNLLEDLSTLNRVISNADPIPANPEKLKDEIDANKVVAEELMRHIPHVAKLDEVLKNLPDHGVEDKDEAEDVIAKVKEINELTHNISNGSQSRAKTLVNALKVADKFFDQCAEANATIRDVKENLYSQEPPGVDSATIQEQLKELDEFKTELNTSAGQTELCRKLGGELSNICGDPGKIEIRKQLEDQEQLVKDVKEIIADREDDLRQALNHADLFQSTLDGVMSWLPVSEHKFASMKAPSSDPLILAKQLEELKHFKAQVHPRIVDMQNLNQQLASLREISPIAAETLIKPVKDMNEKWNDIIHGISERETMLNNMRVKIGELDHTMDDMLNSLQQIDNDLNEFHNLFGDPKCLETYMKRFQLLQSDLNNQGKSCKQITAAVNDVLDNSVDKDRSALKEKNEAMNQLLVAAQANAKDRENKLQDILRHTKKYVGELEDNLQWINEFRSDMKSPVPFGALSDTVKEQRNIFMKHLDEMENRKSTIQSLLTKGQEIVDKCDPEDVKQISMKMKRLANRWEDAKTKAQERKDKFDEHLENVEEFHKTLKTFTDWLNTSEVTMRGFKYPSKLVHKITRQIEEHEAIRSDLEAQTERMNTLDRSGTYLKYFGRKQDTIYIKNLLVGIRLRWKKLLRKTDERGRLLQSAFNEDKRFYDSWKSLCDWLDESAKTLSRFINPSGQVNMMKQDIEELKRFQHQLSSKHPSFYSTSRLGRNLKDRCTKNDPERDELQGMLDDLKNKWTLVRSVVSRSQNKLDEALLTSGRVSDALQSLSEWLKKAETSLEDQPVLGDQDTVYMLIEQHKSMQQELSVRDQTVAAMKASGSIPASQLEDLTNLWDKVNHLSDVRENKLEDALKLAEEFQNVVQVMREFLPQAEAELKFRSMPDDEISIIQLIERHEKFQEDLRNHQDIVDKIKILAEEILQDCHPNAVRFVKYYLTITQTRWDQLIQRAKNRGGRLQDALRNIQGNAALVEELLAWLTDAQVLLATKERDPIPDDLKVVEDLAKDHTEFHDEVTSKNSDVEKLTKLVVNEMKPLSPGRIHGSNMKMNEMDHNPRVLALQSKWRTVWRMSVDRKKKLQDALETLLELESFKNFDFDLWRQRYLKWIQTKKLRITDFFRRQDKDCDGEVTRDEFVNGMLQSRFPTNRTELNAVFEIFDRTGVGRIRYQEFIEALKPDRHKAKRPSSAVSNNKKESEAEMIHDEIEREVSQCQCRRQFKAELIEEGKYRFGETQKIRLVRFLNSCVMVRVGGGWVTLEEFLETNDPCRALGRRSIDFRDSLLLPDSSPDEVTNFRSRNSGSFTPRDSTVGKVKGTPSEAGTCVSSNSSVATHSNVALQKKRMGSSLINLSSIGNNSMTKNPEFGSTGSLNRTKRLSSSSSNLSTPEKSQSRSQTTPRTPTKSSYLTPKTSSSVSSTTMRRATTPTPRSTTPTPRTSRSTTPTPRSKTPQPRSYEDSQYSRTGRRLPSTPKPIFR